MKEILTLSELCEKLKTTRTTVYFMRQKGMPHYMVGRFPRFDLDEVLLWIRSQTESDTYEKRTKELV